MLTSLPRTPLCIWLDRKHCTHRLRGTLHAILFHLLNKPIVGNFINSFCKIHYYYVCLLVISEIVDSVLNKGEELSFCGSLGAEAVLKVTEVAIFF